MIGNRITEGFGVLHAQQGDAGLAPVNLQLQRLMVAQCFPGRRQRLYQVLANRLQVCSIPRSSLAQSSIGLAYQTQYFGFCRQGRCNQFALLAQVLLRTLDRQCLQLALVFVLQLQHRIACNVVVKRQAAEEHGQQQAAKTEKPAWIGGAGSTGDGHGTGCRNLKEQGFYALMAKCYLSGSFSHAVRRNVSFGGR